MAKALGGPITRAGWIAGISAAVLVLPLSGSLADRSSMLGVPVIAAIASILGVGIGALTMPPRSRRAFETFAWLGGREMRRFVARTGTKVPTTPEAVERWLDDNPRSSATAFGRLELLAMLGRTDEAVAEQALARRFTAFIATGTADEAELDALGARLPPDTGLGLELLVARAIYDGRLRLAHGRDDWREPLLGVRHRLGWEATMTTIRDLWSKMAMLMFAVALGIAWLTTLWPR